MLKTLDSSSPEVIKAFISAGGDRQKKVERFTRRCRRWWEIRQNVGLIGILLSGWVDVNRLVHEPSEFQFKKFLAFYSSNLLKMKEIFLEIWPPEYFGTNLDGLYF